MPSPRQTIWTLRLLLVIVLVTGLVACVLTVRQHGGLGGGNDVPTPTTAPARVPTRAGR